MTFSLLNKRCSLTKSFSLHVFHVGEFLLMMRVLMIIVLFRIGGVIVLLTDCEACSDPASASSPLMLNTHWSWYMFEDCCDDPPRCSCTSSASDWCAHKVSSSWAFHKIVFYRADKTIKLPKCDPKYRPWPLLQIKIVWLFDLNVNLIRNTLRNCWSASCTLHTPTFKWLQN